MIWNVKIFLAKIKDCKGKELYFSAKKSLPTKTQPITVKITLFMTRQAVVFKKQNREKKTRHFRLSELFEEGKNRADQPAHPYPYCLPAASYNTRWANNVCRYSGQLADQENWTGRV